MRSYVTSWATGGAVFVAVVREPKLTGGGAGRYSMVVIYSLLPTVVAAAGGRGGAAPGRRPLRRARPPRPPPPPFPCLGWNQTDPGPRGGAGMVPPGSV